MACHSMGQAGAWKKGVFFLAIGVMLLTMGCQSRKEVAEEDSNWQKADALCMEFMKLKKAGDPEADDLVAPLPPWFRRTFAPTDHEEKQDYDATFVLRSSFNKVLKVYPDRRGDTPHFVFVLEGRTPIPRSKRILINPDVVVVIKDDRIVPIEVGIHKPVAGEK